MQTRPWLFVGLFSVLLAAGWPLPSAAQRPGPPASSSQETLQDLTKLELSQVPLAARIAAMQGASGFKPEKAGIDFDENHQVVYELSGKNAQGRQREVDVTAEGTLIEIEDEVTLEEVPPAVRETLKRWLPQFTPTRIELSQRLYFQRWYEFEGQGPQGQELDVEISEDGEKIPHSTAFSGNTLSPS